MAKTTRRIEKAKWDETTIDVWVDWVDVGKVHAVKMPGPVSGSFAEYDGRFRSRGEGPHNDLILTCTTCLSTRTYLRVEGQVVVFPLVTGHIPFHYFVISDPHLAWTDRSGYRLECSVLCPRCRLDLETNADRVFRRNDESGTAVV